MIDEQLSEDERFMRQALTEARKAFEQGEVPVGAVVVWNGRIVGRGHNLVETLSDATAHAEMQAITAAASSVGGKYLAECKLYVTVEPCVMCAGHVSGASWALSSTGRPTPNGAPDGYRPRRSTRRQWSGEAFCKTSARN